MDKASLPAVATGPTCTRRCVIYLKDRTEHRTAWFSNRDRAQRALAIVRARYGNGIVYVD